MKLPIKGRGVKCYKNWLGLTNEQVALFQKEAISMSKLEHNNLVTFIGFCPSECSLIMEYMPGGCLAHLLKVMQSISWQQRYQIALDVAAGMSYLHDCGMAHGEFNK